MNQYEIVYESADADFPNVSYEQAMKLAQELADEFNRDIYSPREPVQVIASAREIWLDDQLFARELDDATAS